MILSESSSAALRPTSGLAPAPEAVCEFDAKLNLHGGARHAQGLKIGVCYHELDSLHAGIDHAVYGVTAASTHADDLYLGVIAGFFVKADANVIVIFHGVIFHG